MYSYSLSFCDWLISLNVMTSEFTYVSCVSISLLFIDEEYSIVCIYHILAIHSYVDGLLGCFYLFTIMNNAAVNIGVQIFVWVPPFTSCGYIPKNRIARAYESLCFTFLRNKLFSTVQFSSVAQLCPTLCDPMDSSTPKLPVHHQLPEFTQTHGHWVSDAIQPSHPLSFSSPPALNLS